MKLSTLAFAVAAATLSFAAQADYRLGGDVTVGYFGNADGDNELLGNGTNFTLSADEKMKGLTYFGQVDIDIADSLEGGDLSSDDMFVGIRGAFGEVRLGDTDNGCDAVDTGWVVDDEWISHDSGGCAGSDKNNVVYKRSMGNATVAASHSPNGSEYSAVGIKGSFGPVAASLGYEFGDELGDSDKNVVLGVSGKIGAVAVGIRASKADDADDTNIGYTAQYVQGPNKFYVGIGDVNDEDSQFLGYQRALSQKTSVIAEYADSDGQDEAEYGIGLKHQF